MSNPVPALLKAYQTAVATQDKALTEKGWNAWKEQQPAVTAARADLDAALKQQGTERK